MLGWVEGCPVGLMAVWLHELWLDGAGRAWSWIGAGSCIMQRRSAAWITCTGRLRAPLLQGGHAAAALAAARLRRHGRQGCCCCVRPPTSKDADAAGDGGGLRHDLVSAHGDVHAAAGAHLRRQGQAVCPVGGWPSGHSLGLAGRSKPRAVQPPPPQPPQPPQQQRGRRRAARRRPTSPIDTTTTLPAFLSSSSSWCTRSAAGGAAGGTS
jgi:hypothetical protein